MAPLTIPDDVRAKAEIYVGDAAGQEKTRLLLQETGLPSGLLPLRDIVECGYVEDTGFVWLKQRRKVDHYFAGAGRHVSYGAEVSAVAEKGRLKKITGVKAKEMLIWVSLHEICLDDYNNPPAAAAAGGNKKLVCKALGGLSRSFPVEAFEAAPAPVNNKPTPVAATTNNRDAVVVVSGNGAAAAKGQEEAKKQEEVEKQPEEEEQAKKEGDDKQAKVEEEKDGKQAKGDAIDAVEEKFKDMTTTTEAVHAEAVAAKN